jgi:hypothetical protein
VLSRYERLAELGYADDDHSALHRLLAGEG